MPKSAKKGFSLNRVKADKRAVLAAIIEDSLNIFIPLLKSSDEIINRIDEIHGRIISEISIFVLPCIEKKNRKGMMDKI